MARNIDPTFAHLAGEQPATTVPVWSPAEALDRKEQAIAVLRDLLRCDGPMFLGEVSDEVADYLAREAVNRLIAGGVL